MMLYNQIIANLNTQWYFKAISASLYLLIKVFYIDN